MIISHSQEKDVKTGLRLPAHMYDEIFNASQRNGISMNAEILTRLRAAPTLEVLNEIKQHNARIEDMQRQILLLMQG